MFGLFSRKKQQVQNWHSPDVFLKELAKQDIPHQVRSNVSLYDVDFEKLVPVLNSDSNVWHRLASVLFKVFSEKQISFFP